MLCCGLQGQLRYELVGEPPAPEYFLVDLATGVVTIRQSLMTHYAPYYVVSTRNINGDV